MKTQNHFLYIYLSRTLTGKFYATVRTKRRRLPHVQKRILVHRCRLSLYKIQINDNIKVLYKGKQQFIISAINEFNTY